LPEQTLPYTEISIDLTPIDRFLPAVRRLVAMPLRLILLLLTIASVLAPAELAAQQKFTTQILIVPAFRGADRGVAGKASDILRSRIAGTFRRDELRVVSGGDIDDWLRLSGFEQNAVLSEGEMKEMARKFRADERITGVVTRTAGHVHIDAELSLIRDLRMTQPLSSDGATVNDAAEALAREAVAARRQLVPLRLCENAEREKKHADAVAAAASGVAAYPAAVPARVCLLGALARLDAPADSVIAVSQAILRVAPANPIALEDLAMALDSQGKSESAAPVWVRLLATDTASESLTEQVVNALAREGNSRLAAPLIDRATDQHPDNLPLLKLRWLVHLAFNDWKPALRAGEGLLERDAAAQSDPDFYARLASAYRADSQPSRALATAALGVSRFPRDAPLFVEYLQLLRAENEAALPRGLAQFPENAELHVLAAQNLKNAGNAAAALEETKRALAANPRLPHGYLQLAQLEIDAAQPESALVAIDLATKNGEDRATVAQFALARGNALYKAATGTQKREDYQRAIRFLTLAESLAPSPEAKFLLGASALSVSQSAATEATPAKSCELSRLADSSLTDAEINLVSGGSAAPDAAKQFLDYVAKLRPYVADELKSFCAIH
jgi:tetratricopeptide (TPR) repeat protein